MHTLHLTKVFAILLCTAVVAQVASPQAAPRLPGELAWTIGYDPKSFDPAKVDEEESEHVRYLTAGVLLRFNRYSQQVETQLAKSWSLSPDRMTITFVLRPGLAFSDGSRLTANDAAWSIRRVLLPATAAPVAEEFVEPAGVTVATPNDHTVVVHLPKPVVGIGKVFDEIAIEPAGRPSEGRITSGPYFVADYHRSQYIRLRRNEHFQGREGDRLALASANSIRLDVLDNAEKEIRLFQREEYDVINGLAPDYYGLLKQKSPSSVRDLGPSLNTEQIWFNQAAASPIPAWEKTWFQSQAFRVAISQTINRADLARVAYEGHATPAYNFISPANVAWYNHSVSTPHFDVAAAKAGLAHAGFRMNAGHLEDAAGHAVAFSILTNSGNAARMKMATLIQQDLAALGIRVTVVALDFPALIERLMHTQDYEACLLGISNADPDPNAAMNLWLSSSPNHQWNPSEKTPATPWEAEIDRAMQQQATSPTEAGRKRAIDRVQQIVADQQPFIYLVYPNALYAVSPKLENVKAAVLNPGVVWNVESLHLQGAR
ncbi:peptide/nickel transport system substrate-binding protein [Granulicella aggregans]|uniref:Peptide/nickel transport system substrate-binding protein n=1 Tax=Granulicella aggregans TaxID=474949 RepID=A0A7W8E1G5_9BACT|nr:ABC transporter substrate-binding protein [Granulicella aggregans]MBB5055803.1 peptide/nickel transport system substrate-binding protein [Granulicella aggregans]